VYTLLEIVNPFDEKKKDNNTRRTGKRKKDVLKIL
jgi:hypothetical protein